MATYNVSSGQVASNELVYGDVETVSSGGVTQDQHNGGQRFVLSGGIVRNGVVSSGGKDYISSGGSSFQGVIQSGGIRYLSAGATADNPFIAGGGTVSAATGATVLAVNAFSGGVLSAATGAVISGGNVATGAVITANAGTLLEGTINVSSGSTVTNGTLTGSGAALSAYTGSVISNVSVGSSTRLYLGSGATGSANLVNGGTLEIAGGATPSNNRFGSGTGGTIIIDSGTTWSNNNTTSLGVTSGNTLIIQSGGVVTGTVIASGGTTVISSGGILRGTQAVVSGATLSINTVNSGATVNVQSGGVVSGLTTVASAGVLSAASNYIYSGTVTNYGAVYGGTLSGSAQLIASGAGANSLTSGVSIESGGRLYLGSGATGSANLVNGGTLEIASGATPSSNRFGSGTGGTIIIDSGVTWSNANSAAYNVTSGNTLVIQSGGTVSGTVIAAGGTTVISSGGVIAGTQTVSSGGTLVLNGTAGNGAVNLAGDGANLVISGTTMPTNTISGWSPTDTIELASIPAASVTSVTTSTTGITFYTKGGTYTLNVPGASKYGYELQSDSNGGLVYTTCFAEGTSLMTPDGEAAVETLVPGTLVMTPKGAMPVKWLGHRSITVASQPVPEDNWLVRIREGALADGVPSRDLLVTQEHCMVFEGKLVPARMLVNGASILIDRTINSYTYYHVELDSHEAVWAENALTESYLDTGNRDQFDNHTVTALFGGSRKTGGSSTLPLETSRAFVEPIHAAIVARATSVAPQPELTTDPDLHLVTNFGQVIRPLRTAHDRVMFMIPANVATVRLVSRTSRPSDTIGPFVDDRRDLGVLVGEVSLFAARQTTNLTTHLSIADLSGWHGLESSTYRWTDGNAALPLQSHVTLNRDPSVLSVQIVSSGPYLMDAPVAETELRQVG
ncbi:Hint domain-containing protein [Gluconobacter japonicus]|uniref:Hint domain-containing protein n=1 Tax=Gluconobacter japonicus TaxID=376620 RepID=UPI0039EB7DCA